MNTVNPIRDRAMLKRVKECAMEMGEQPYMLIQLGVNTGLRVSDLLQLRVGDLRDRGFIVRREQKTGKQTQIKINPAVTAEIVRLTSTRDSRELLFPSPDRRRRGKPITRGTAYNWVKKACIRALFMEPAGCHTLRKTYGYLFYEQFRNIALLMRHFNHSNEAITMRYIGCAQEELDRATMKFKA